MFCCFRLKVATGLFAVRYKTIAVSFFADEAAKWKEALGDADFEPWEALMR